MSNRLTIILGPTAIGKTDYAIEYALKVGSPVVSCDSRQIFEELNIGVARPSEEQLARVRHYFIASHSVEDYYTAGRYEIEALELLKELFKTHDEVVMVGGSGLYIDALCNGLDDFPVADRKLRDMLSARLEKEGIESLRHDLLRLDPESYNTIDIANGQRVIRALEVTISTGRPFSSYKTSPRRKRDFEIVKMGLGRDRRILYDRIGRRVDTMMEDGLLQEARDVLKYRSLPALNTVGYKELFDYFDGLCSLDVAVERIKRDTRHYAKRQMTWWRRYSDIQWIPL